MPVRNAFPAARTPRRPSPPLRSIIASAPPSDQLIEEIVDRLVPRFEPLRIFLFGSRARGDGREGSDLDLLVVVPEVGKRDELAAEMQRALRGLAPAVDVFPTDPEEIARTGDSVGSFVHPVLREGRVIFGVDERDAGTWLRYAREDLETAERMLEGQGFALRWACYLAQQAVEKALKAVLVSERIRFPYTHDLENLRELLPTRRHAARVDADLTVLSRWATAARYPPAGAEVSLADAREAVDTARTVVAAAVDDLDAA